MNEMEIIPLGTVSPYCKNELNCPGFLVKYNKYSILLDCGNGISRYLDFPNILNNLYVFVTHLHSDHYGDLSTIEYASYVYNNLGLLSEKPKIYTPNGCNRYKNINYCDYYTLNENTFVKLGDLKICFHNNNSHDIESYMIKLENNKTKIVYTSDIGNTNIDDVVRFSNNADLLICESSLLRIHKKSKTHLCAYEAAIIAKEAKVNKLLLTHFWPEIDKQEYLNEASLIFDNTDVALENKKIILKK